MKNGPLSLLFHLFFVVFLLAPMALVCLVAFTPGSYLTLPTQEFSLRWFVKLSDYPDFLVAFRNSLLIATVSSVLALAFAVPAAIAIARYRFVGREALSAFFLSPLMIPHVVLGIAFLRFFQMLGISGTITGLVIGMLWLSSLSRCVWCLPPPLEWTSGLRMQLPRWSAQDGGLPACCVAADRTWFSERLRIVFYPEFRRSNYDRIHRVSQHHHVAGAYVQLHSGFD